MLQLRDSKLDPAWLAQAMADNPPTINAADGTITSGPVRIGFCSLTRTTKARLGDDGQMRDGKYEVEALYPYDMNGLSALYNAWYFEAKRVHSGKFDAQGNYFGLEVPFRDQGAKANKPGYTPGLIMHKVSTQIQPLLVDAHYNEIRDPKEIYSGCWAILSMNLWDYNNRKQGVSFGLLTFMKIADDLHTYGGGSNPQQAFSGVRITPSYSPKGAMTGGTAPLPGQPPRGPNPMPQSYGQPAQAPAAPSYPAGGYGQPPAPPAAAGYQPPQPQGQQGYAPPPPPQAGYGAPQAPVPPQTGYGAPQAAVPPAAGGFQHAAPPPPPPPPPPPANR